MKRLALISMTVAACLSLAACGNSNDQAEQESEISSLKTANSKLKKKIQAKKKAAKKNSSSATSDKSQGGQQTQASNTPASNGQGQQASADPTTSTGNLHDFVNQYGVSPARYKMEHQGMSELEALQSTPTGMKTSGEIQMQHILEQQQGQATPQGN
ncbi:hypothetical protein [Limosilactobacillus ingluviei]|uniref:hypothetical protein n=1 Tax=Limosilactobacillus ingluviei TaxID=148604 RepID=UPI00195CD688|nr:hypothetical protein [Limosilactobacillus ingluviei]MBM6729321.1 hypothetical protein [Limosilactobacillus ingluviei]